MPKIQHLTDINGLLLAVWPEKSGRPSARTIRNWQVRRVIPFVKVGRLVMFDPDRVRDALAKLEVEEIK